MRVAYLITAHNNYEHLRRLLAALDDERVHCYVHIDAKSPMPTHLGDLRNVTFVERTQVWWGGWSMTLAVLRLMRAALADGYDYYAIVSGAHYPIRSNEWFFDRLGEGGEFIDMAPLEGQPAHFWNRIRFYHFDRFDRRNRRSCRYIVMRSIERLLRIVARKRRPPFERIYQGFVWMTLSDGCVRHLLEVIDTRRDVVRFFRTAYIPDESLFASIVGNSPFGDRVRGALTYDHWLEGRSGPETLAEHHLAPMGRGEWFFARKFDDASKDLCERIDKTLRA